MLDRAGVEKYRSGRRALRRAVAFECEVFSDSWDGAIPLAATNLSHLGLWVETPLPLQMGEEIMVSLRPPRWPLGSPLLALAMVARVGLARRRGEAGEAGMGLAFTDIDAGEASMLTETLIGMPPPLPRSLPDRSQLPVVGQQRRQRGPLERIVRLDDGSAFRFIAEGSLLTGGRAADAPRLRLVSSHGLSVGGVKLPSRSPYPVAA